MAISVRYWANYVNEKKTALMYMHSTLQSYSSKREN